MTEDAGQDEGTSMRFFVCAWNVRRNDEWQAKDDDLTRKTVSTLLAALGHYELSEAALESAADLILVIPRDRDRPFSIHDLRFYSLGLGGKPKKVLYVHAGMEPGLAEGPINDWLFCAGRASCPMQDLHEWLSARTPHGTPDRDKLISAAAKAHEETRTRLDTLEARRRGIPRTAETTFGRTGRQLLEDVRVQFSPARFFFALCRLSNAYDRVEHDINARRAQGDLTDTERLFFAACLDFLNACADARTAITACSQAVTAPDAIRHAILLVDDNPTRGGFKKNLADAIPIYLPGFTLWTWNPDAVRGAAVKGSELSRKDVEAYSSWTRPGTEDFLARQLLVEEGNAKAEPKSLGDVLEGTHVVLADILFQDARGIDHEAGYGLVRGLQRIFRDFQHKMPKGWYIPQVLAVSRASDIEKVHTVYRSGAAGYLLKERPLSVPGAIARTLQPSADGVRIAHRNFRAMYNLPHATLGQLHATCIPRIPFHQPPMVAMPKPSDAKAKKIPEQDQARRRTDLQLAQPLAELIAILPKADLHVHPGTCMKPEFLVVASLVMLVRHDIGTGVLFNQVVRGFAKTLDGCVLSLKKCPVVTQASPLTITNFGGHPAKLAGIAKELRNSLIDQVLAGDVNRQVPSGFNPQIDVQYRELRSILHAEFGIPDHVAANDVCRRLRELSDAKCFFFALRHCEGKWNEPEVLPKDKTKKIADDKDDLLRLYLLWLAGHAEDSNRFSVDITGAGADNVNVPLVKWFHDGDIVPSEWETLRKTFYQHRAGDQTNHTVDPHCSKVGMERANWWLFPDEDRVPGVRVELGERFPQNDFLSDCPPVAKSPIAWLVASGTRSSNLREYLEGSDYTGAEHLRHPFLMHLFAQQAVYEFIRHGVLYAELRTALSGYANPHLDISFSDACTCFRTAMGQAQQIAQYAYFKAQPPDDARGTPVWIWRNCFVVDDLFNPVNDELASYRFPCKTSIVLTGKRDKPSRVLLREAGAGAVLHARPVNPAASAMGFVQKAVPECRVVGFDLAGQEDDHPPQFFREEYNQIARMHIPVTAHAGENAPSDFVESAILDLRAQRIGHGLALADDKALMERARDDGTCIELCPVSNFQTNAVHPHSTGRGREYPLFKFLDAGLNVTINTDNPVVSYTNMVKECFQAAYALGSEPLSLWDLLRILRAGFTQSFLTQPERHAVLELADQLVFDLFSRPEIVSMLTMLPAAPPRPAPPPIFP